MIRVARFMVKFCFRYEIYGYEIYGRLTRFMGVYEIYGRVYEIYGSLRDLWELRDLWGVHYTDTSLVLASKPKYLPSRLCRGLRGLGFGNMYDYFCLIFWFSFLPDKKIQFYTDSTLVLASKLKSLPSTHLRAPSCARA